MKIIIVLLFLLPAFNICRAELTLPKLEKPAPAMQPASNEQKGQEAKPVKKEDPNKCFAKRRIKCTCAVFTTLHKAAIVNDMAAIKYIVGKGLKYKNFDMTPALIATIE